MIVDNLKNPNEFPDNYYKIICVEDNLYPSKL